MMTSAVFARESVVLVLDFRNDGEKRYNYYGPGIAKTIGNDLACMKTVTVITPEARRLALEEIGLSQSGILKEEIKTGTILGANYICTGHYELTKSGMKVTAEFFEIDTQSLVESFMLECTTEQFPDRKNQIAFHLVELLRKKGIALRGSKESAFDSSGKTNSNNSQAFEYYCMGLGMQHSDPVTAMEYFRKAVNADGTYIDALLEMARICNDPLSRYDEALMYVTRAESVLQERNETQSLAYAKMMEIKSSIFTNLSKLDNSLESCKAGMAVLTNIGMEGSFEHSELLNDCGLVYRKMGNPDKALECYQRSLEIKDRLGLKKSIYYAISLSNISAAHLAKSETAAAMEYCLRAKAAKKELGLEKTRTYSISLANEGAILCAARDYDKALERFSDARKILEKLDLTNTRDYANVLTNMGYVRSQCGEHAKAVSLYTDAQGIRKKIGLEKSGEYAAACMDLANILHRNLDRSCDACTWVETGTRIKREIGMEMNQPDLILIEELKLKCNR